MRHQRQAQPGEDPRTALRFLKELRDHDLHDQAIAYLKMLRADAQLPAAVKDVLDYEEGITLIDEAAKTNDLVLRDELLRDASEKLEGFAKTKPQLRQGREAQVHIGKLLLDRGHTAMLLSEEAQDPTKKATKIAEARAAFDQAHEAYAKAVEPLKAEHKKYIGFIEPSDPRAAERDAIYSRTFRRALATGRSGLRARRDLP